jgi:hypothetical protein
VLARTGLIQSFRHWRMCRCAMIHGPL